MRQGSGNPPETQVHRGQLGTNLSSKSFQDYSPTSAIVTLFCAAFVAIRLISLSGLIHGAALQLPGPFSNQWVYPCTQALPLFLLQPLPQVLFPDLGMTQSSSSSLKMLAQTIANVLPPTPSFCFNFSMEFITEISPVLIFYLFTGISSIEIKLHEGRKTYLFCLLCYLQCLVHDWR